MMDDGTYLAYGLESIDGGYTQADYLISFTMTIQPVHS